MPPVTSLQTLLAAAGTPAAAPVLQPGAVMQAMVAQLLDDMTLRLQLPGGAALDVKADQALPVGTRVQIFVEGTAAQPKILLTPLPTLSTPAAASVPAAQTATSTNPGSPAANDPAPANLPPAAAVVVENAKPLPASVQLVLPETAISAPKQVLQAAVTAMVRDAVSKQNGLAPLMTDIEAALARPDLPQPVRAAAAQLLALRVETNAPVTAPDIKAAVVRSGIAGDPVTLQPAALASSGDLKAALTTLKDALTNWVVKEQGADPALAQPKPQAPASVPLPLPQRAVLPPPHRLAPTIPQAPLPASLPEEASAREAALHLLKATDGALARQTLLQIASLPDDSTNRAEQGPRLTLDIPLALAQGTGVAQLRIEQEPARRDGPDIRPVWRAQFSIDVEPIGPVHASIALFGERAAVTLYAERDMSAEKLREGLPVLEASLKDAAFETGELLCRAGAPSAPKSAPGLFVDQAS